MAQIIILAVIVLLIWAEIAVFGLIGGAVGALAVIAGVFVTAAIGVRLFRHIGRGTLRRMAEANAHGKPPVAEVADGIAIMLAAGLLLIPGYVTDVLGLIFFIPHLRIFLVAVVLSGVLSHLSSIQFATARHHSGWGFRPGGFWHGDSMQDNLGADDSRAHDNKPFEGPPFDDHRPKPAPAPTPKKNTAPITIEGEFERKD